MTESATSELARHIRDVALIDQHVHGCWLTAGERSRFENALNEANTQPLADFDSAFDSQLGFALRKHCGPILACLNTLTRKHIGNIAASSGKPNWLSGSWRPPG